MDSQVVNEAAEAIKEEGNTSFKSGDFVTALRLYTEAIELDPCSSKYLINRSLCYASMNDWANSAEDARASLKLAPKAQKAHFRLVKALFELGRFKDARLAILNGLKECGESKEMKSLEDELMVRTGIPLRPKSTDFEIVGELGDGNFSKVYKAMHKSTNRVFAIKTIEKMTVDRMKKRHGNINNEILMEKRALHRLDHPGIVTLYNTFQDYGTLYYQMEYIGGNDLWHRLHEVQLTGRLTANGSNSSASDGDNAQHVQVGCHWSLARFYMAQAIDGIEHMHQRGIAHRDIKPENMIITENGHLKFVDFGTAKDFVHTDLNGPEFVGTPEYLSPSTVRNKKCGVEVDLWALGIVLHQMLLGYTPYGAPSPYLTFLRIKRSFLQIPDWIPAPLASMIRLLLQTDARARLRSACGISPSSDLDASTHSPSHSSPLGTTKHPSGINYDALRGHEMFANAHATCPGVCSSHASTFDDLSTVESVRSVYEREAHKMPTLRELSLRATGRAALLVAAATAENGGVRPKSPAWMQTFNLAKLCALDRAQIKHYLTRQQRLHTPGVYRLFCASVVETRSRRSDPSTGEYIGLTRGLQGHWDKDFHFVQLASPMFGSPSVSTAEGIANGEAGSEPVEETRLKALIAAVNKLRPKFLVMIGDLTHATPADGAVFDAQVESVRKTMARLSDTIPAIYVPGSRDVGAVPTPATLQAYRERFGADYFGFWYGGMRGVVINSSLLISPQGAPEEAARQEVWLTEEIEQCKLCSNCIVVFSYHPWFVSDIDEPDMESDSGIVSTFPRALRQKWLKKLRHHKVMLAIASSTGSVQVDLAALANTNNAPCVEAEAEVAINVTKSKALRPFPRKKGTKAKKIEDEVQDMTADLAKQALEVITRPDGEPMRPSEIIAAALSSGELSPQDVTPEVPEVSEASVMGTESRSATEETAGSLPAVPSIAADQTAGAVVSPPVVPDQAGHDINTVSETESVLPDLAKEDEAEAVAEEESDSDKDSDYEPDEDAEKNDQEEEEFANEEEDYEGPELLFPTTSGVTGLRAVLVREHDMQHAFYPSSAVPASLAELLEHLSK